MLMNLFFLRTLTLVSLFLLFSCHEGTHSKEEHSEPHQKHELGSNPVFHASHEPKKANAPFSDVVQVGNTFYLAGQIGMDHKTRTLADSTIQGQTRQTLENIKAVLEQHDLGMENVVKALVILDNIEDFAAFNEIYTTYLPQKPARTTFAAEALAAGALIEIEVVAVGNSD